MHKLHIIFSFLFSPVRLVTLASKICPAAARPATAALTNWPSPWAQNESCYIWNMMKAGDVSVVNEILKLKLV